jgi:hypothetical protein
MADDALTVRDNDVVMGNEVILVCAQCGMEIAGEPFEMDDEVYCCAGCADGTGCTCIAA